MILQEFTPRGKQTVPNSPGFSPSHRMCYQIRQALVERSGCDVPAFPACPLLPISPCPGARAGAELPELMCIHPETSLGSVGL